MTVSVYFNVFIKKWHGVISCRTIGLLICVLITTATANPIGVSEQTNGPCNMEGSLTGELSDEHRTISSLVNRVSSVILLAEKAKTINIPKMLTASELPVGYTFLPEEQFSTTGGNFSTDSLDAAGEFKYYYEEIFKLKFYIDEAANGLLLGTHSIQGDLRSISSKLQEMLCDIYIEFSFHNGDVSTLPEFHDLSPAFVLPKASLYNESRRAYILLNDCENLMGNFGMLVANHASAIAQ